MRVQPVPCVSTPAPVPWGIWASSEPPAGPTLPELELGCAPGRSGARDHLPARAWEAPDPREDAVRRQGLETTLSLWTRHSRHHTQLAGSP